MNRNVIDLETALGRIRAARGTTETSRAAALVAERRSPRLRRQILQLLAAKPLACFELAEMLGIERFHDVSYRVSELKRAGLVEPSVRWAKHPCGKLVPCVRLPGQDDSAWRVEHTPVLGRNRWRFCLRPANCRRLVETLAQGPKTVCEIAAATGLKRHTADVTTSAARQACLVEPSGVRRPSDRGCLMIVWRLRPGPYHQAVPAEIVQFMEDHFRIPQFEFSFAGPEVRNGTTG